MIDARTWIKPAEVCRCVTKNEGAPLSCRSARWGLGTQCMGSVFQKPRVGYRAMQRFNFQFVSLWIFLLVFLNSISYFSLQPAPPGSFNLLFHQSKLPGSLSSLLFPLSTSHLSQNCFSRKKWTAWKVVYNGEEGSERYVGSGVCFVWGKFCHHALQYYCTHAIIKVASNPVVLHRLGREK